jgi:hypothetical protein
VWEMRQVYACVENTLSCIGISQKKKCIFRSAPATHMASESIPFDQQASTPGHSVLSKSWSPSAATGAQPRQARVRAASFCGPTNLITRATRATLSVCRTMPIKNTNILAITWMGSVDVHMHSLVFDKDSTSLVTLMLVRNLAF